MSPTGNFLQTENATDWASEGAEFGQYPKRDGFLLPNHKNNISRCVCATDREAPVKLMREGETCIVGN